MDNYNSDNNRYIDTAPEHPPKKRFAKGVLETTLCIIIVLTLISLLLLFIRLADYSHRDEGDLLLKSDTDERFDIFSVYYSNDAGEITVMGANGNEVIAPGTKTEYTVRLRNRDDVAIDYMLVPTVSYTSVYTVPIEFRMLDTDGKYLIGDAKTWVKAQDIGDVRDGGTLVKGGTAEYVFEWRWQFESGDDQYDTFLGLLAKYKNVGVTVSFDLLAQANTDIDANGGIDGSGMGEIIFIAFVLLLLVIALILLIVYLVKKHKYYKQQDKDRDNDQDGQDEPEDDEIPYYDR